VLYYRYADRKLQQEKFLLFKEGFLMAERPVFITSSKKPYYDVCKTQFVWNAGLSASQKKKNVVALHQSFSLHHPERKILEISTKSQLELGTKLSAFNLYKFVPSLGRSISIECIYQGGKVFSDGGPYTDLYEGTSRQAKKDPRLSSSGLLRSFYFEGETIPLVPKTAFYNWLYINALIETPELAEQILQFDSFTDIEFSPDKGVNCQARAAAIFVSLHQKGLLDQCRNFSDFVALSE